MPLLNDHLTVWEIGFRWARLDPDRLWLRIPLLVRDNFRNLMDAILQGHLYCDTLALEKWSESSGDDPKSYIRHWLDDIYACIQGHHCKRELLKWAWIDRWAMQLWCERRGIPLPEFWFPAGWRLEYKWPQEPEHEEPPEDKPTSVVDENDEEPVQVAEPAAPQAPPAETPSPSQKEGEIAGKRALDWRQRGRIACQEVAKRYWAKHPEALLKTVAASPEVQDIAPGSDFDLVVVERWMSEIDRRDPATKRGPKKR